MFYEAIKISSRLQVATGYLECVFTNRKSDDRLCCLKDIYTWQRSRNDYSEIRIRIMMIFTNQASTTRHLLWNRKDPLHLRNSKPNPTDIYFFILTFSDFLRFLKKLVCHFSGWRQTNFFILYSFFWWLGIVLSLGFFKSYLEKKKFNIFSFIKYTNLRFHLKPRWNNIYVQRKHVFKVYETERAEESFYRMYIYFSYIIY